MFIYTTRSSKKTIVTALYTYPIKGCRAISHAKIAIDRGGFVHDREWAIVQILPNELPVLLTTRRRPKMTLIVPSFSESGLLELTLPTGQRHLVIPPSQQQKIAFNMGGALVESVDEGNPIAEFLTCFFGHPVRLVRMSSPMRKLRNCTQYGHLAANGDVSRFSDWSPFSLVSEASLSHLNRHLEHSVEISRFRPNIVIDGVAPHEESRWLHLMIGGVAFRVAKRCKRCAVTTVDPDSGKVDACLEPLRTLKNLTETQFAVNLIHDESAIGKSLRIGDAVSAT